MKKTFFLFLLSSILAGCSNNNFNNNNPYLPNYTFSIEINTDLPSYSNLKYVSNAVYYQNAGVRGIYIFNNGSGFNAFDAACPNQQLSNCSTMTLNGINLICPCDSENYNLFTGQSTLQYPLKQYRVQVNGPVIHVYN